MTTIHVLYSFEIRNLRKLVIIGGGGVGAHIARGPGYIFSTFMRFSVVEKLAETGWSRMTCESFRSTFFFQLFRTTPGVDPEEGRG